MENARESSNIIVLFVPKLRGCGTILDPIRPNYCINGIGIGIVGIELFHILTFI